MTGLPKTAPRAGLGLNIPSYVGLRDVRTLRPLHASGPIERSIRRSLHASVYVNSLSAAGACRQVATQW